MLYIFPSPPVSVPLLEAYPRLYAFPRVPSHPAEDSFIILDSGAFGLARVGGVMDQRHINALRDHYATFSSARVVCVAPDVYLKPSQTFENFKAWHTMPDAPSVAPVIQFRRARHLDTHSAYLQALRYREYLPLFPQIQGKAVLFLSNPALRAAECGALQTLCQMIRSAYPVPLWLHWLGAGWDAADVRGYAQTNALDSIDSIAYYTDAQQGLLWQADGNKRQTFDADLIQAIVHNIQMADSAARGD